MRVVIITASKHHSTHEVGAQLASAIAHLDAALDVSVSRCAATAEVIGADTVVLGSALYGTRWLRPARAFLGAHAADLARTRLWTFTCGLAKRSGTEGPSPATPVLGREVPHVHLGGRVDLTSLSASERVFVRGLGAGDCDTRDVVDVERLATRVVQQLVDSSAVRR